MLALGVKEGDAATEAVFEGEAAIEAVLETVGGGLAFEAEGERVEAMLGLRLRVEQACEDAGAAAASTLTHRDGAYCMRFWSAHWTERYWMPSAQGDQALVSHSRFAATPGGKVPSQYLTGARPTLLLDRLQMLTNCDSVVHPKMVCVSAPRLVIPG